MTTPKNVQLEEISPRNFRLEIPLDLDALAKGVDERLHALRPQVEAPGFRRGKAPLPVLQRLYGAALRQQQWARQAQNAVRRELAERGLHPVAAPTLERLAGGAAVAATFAVFRHCRRSTSPRWWCGGRG